MTNQKSNKVLIAEANSAMRAVQSYLTQLQAALDKGDLVAAKIVNEKFNEAVADLSNPVQDLSIN